MQFRPDPPPDTHRKTERLPSLDGLRAIAILLVLGGHFQYTAGFPFEKLGFAFVVLDGELGVRIFFVISGFIITRLLLEEARTYGSVSLPLFYTRRALRILPIYCAYLGVLAIFSAAGRYTDSASSWLGCLTFTRNLIGRGNSATEHFWSLAVEEQFYLCWPILFFLLRLERRRPLALIVLVSVSVSAIVIRDLFDADQLFKGVANCILGARSLFRYADSIAIGCGGGFIHAAFAGVLARRLTAFWGLVAALLLAVEQVYLKVFVAKGSFVLPFGLMSALMPTVQALTVIALLLCTLSSANGPIYSLLNQRLMVRIGVLSYSLYVWHFIFLKSFAPDAWGFSWIYGWAVWWLPAVALSILSWEFLESPILKLRRAFRRSSKNQTGAVNLLAPRRGRS